MNSKIINLFGGPGIGKSTLASELFSVMKKMNCSVEITQEYPKILAWEKNISSLTDQLYVLANQHRNISRIYNQVEYIIVDSPILLSNVYFEKYSNKHEYPTNFYDEILNEFVVKLFKRYDNINFLLSRNDYFFNQSGRLQDLNESKNIDDEIKRILSNNNIQYYECELNNDTINKILEKI